MKKILIVGTMPYNKNSPARAFDAYFNGYDRDSLAQIFSHTKAPVKGHASRFYQITDKQMLKAFFDKKADTGTLFEYADLADDWQDHDLEVGTGTVRKLYAFGAKKTSLTHLMRGILWRKKNWCTKKLDDWLDCFRPDCVFLAFSNDYFILNIALYVAKRFDIPIISCIGDDYYFNYNFSLSPLYHIYKLTYRRLVRKVFSHGGSAIYISNKIRDKYNSEFGLDGQTVYLTSEVKRRPFSPVNSTSPEISYFGNIGQGRNESLAKIGSALLKLDPSLKINVYSGQTDAALIKVLNDAPGVVFHGSIPYTEVVEKTAKSDILVIVEGFKKKHVNNTRYSLSTKAADSLASGSQILVFGSEDCGVIEYMLSTNAAAVSTDEESLVPAIKSLLYDQSLQIERYNNAIKMTEQNHTLKSSTNVFRGVVEKAISNHVKNS